MNHFYKYRWNTPLIRSPLIHPLPGTGTSKYSHRWSLEFAQEWRAMSWIWPPGAKSWDPWNLGVLTRLDVWKCRTNPKLDLTFCLGSGRGLRLQYDFPTKNKQTKNHQDLEMMMKLKWPIFGNTHRKTPVGVIDVKTPQSFQVSPGFPRLILPKRCVKRASCSTNYEVPTGLEK